MDQWIILPYDGSPVARAALQRTARHLRASAGERRGIMLAIADGSAAPMPAVVARARQLIGSEIPISARMLEGADAAAALDGLASELPGATFAAPLGPAIERSWYRNAVGYALSSASRSCYVFHLTPDEVRLQCMEDNADGRSRLDSRVGGVFRALFRLSAGVRTHVNEAP